MKKTLFTTILIFLFFSCQTEKENHNKEKYKRWVGDIEQDSIIDNNDFKICNGDENILQYYWGNGPSYIDEKTSIQNIFQAKYSKVDGENTNGLIRIRFVVNCEGKANRFRTLQSDYNYNEIRLDEKIVSQLVDITKGIDSWEIIYAHNKPIDYYI